MEETIRIAFAGFNHACSRLVQTLSGTPQVEFVGVLGKEMPPGWPPGAGPPDLFAECEDLLRSHPDVLFVAEEPGELEGVPSGCQVIHAREGSPLARLMGSLPASSHTGSPAGDDIREIASLCSSINVVEAYSDPMPKLSQLLDRSMAVSGAELGVMLLPGDILDELDVVLARGEGAKELVGRGLSTTASLCGRAFDEGILQMASIGKEIEEHGYLKESGLRNLLALPLRAEGRVIGVFALGRGEGGFDVIKMPLLTLLADQAGLAVLISRLYSELETSVVQDAASGLYNLHYFQHQLRKEVSRARRYSLNVCLMFFRIDDYEGYIQRNGRRMGDLILTDIGNIVKRNTREVDTAARCGDNLFAALLPETRRLGAMRLAERIRKVVGEYPFPSREKKEVEALTVCVGVSSFPANADNGEDLMNRALEALTAARDRGHDNVMLYSDDIADETA